MLESTPAFREMRSVRSLCETKVLSQAPVGPAVLPHRFYNPVIGGVGQGKEGDRPSAILLS